MLSQIDTILFPDECVVLDVGNGRYVYPIFKNGSTSLNLSNFKSFYMHSEQMRNVEIIDVFIREPIGRYISGVNTYLTNNGMDFLTSRNFIKQFLFLDRHFAPQFFWLLNLQRYTKAKMRLLSMSEISKITPLYENTSNDIKLPGVANLGNDSKIQFYLQLDNVLAYDLLGHTVTFKQIVQTIKHRYPEVYKEVIQRSIDLCNVLV
jgi:hypothetical protein